MLNELSFTIIALMVLIFTVTAVVIIFTWNRKRNSPPTIGTLRQNLERIEQDFQGLKEQVWNYSNNQEELSKRWRVACITIAQKSVSTLQSSWLVKEQDPSAKALYDELLQSLRTIGVEEIMPAIGENIDENDRRYRIMEKTGESPYQISGIISPGYGFKSSVARIKDSEGYVVLEPALIKAISRSKNSDLTNNTLSDID